MMRLIERVDAVLKLAEKHEAIWPALEYVAKLQGRSVDALVADVLDGWLTENYADSVEHAERKRGLPSSLVLNRRGNLNRKAAFRVMCANMDALSVA
jgi:hypothetical protein